MDYNPELYKNKTPYPSKVDYIKIIFYDRLRKEEIKLSVSDAKTCEGMPHLTRIHEELDAAGFEAARRLRYEEDAVLDELFIKNLLENEGLPDNKLTRSLVSHARYDHEHSQDEAWYNMRHYTEIYFEAKEFFQEQK